MKNTAKKLVALLLLCATLTGFAGTAAPAQAATAASKVAMKTVKLGKRSNRLKYGGMYVPAVKGKKIVLFSLRNKTSKKLAKVKFTITGYKGSKKVAQSKFYVTKIAAKKTYYYAVYAPGTTTRVTYKVTYAK